MTARLIFILILALLFGAFVSINWSAFLVPTSLSLLVTTVQAPLGLVLLVILGAVVLLFAGFMVWWQGRMLFETRRHTKELQTQRELADRAEASRFTELQARLDAEFAKLSDRLGARIDSSTAALRTELQHTGNGLAAAIGELEDRVERMASPGQPLIGR